MVRIRRIYTEKSGFGGLGHSSPAQLTETRGDYSQTCILRARQGCSLNRNADGVAIVRREFVRRGREGTTPPLTAYGHALYVFTYRFNHCDCGLSDFVILVLNVIVSPTPLGVFRIPVNARALSSLFPTQFFCSPRRRQWIVYVPKRGRRQGRC